MPYLTSVSAMPNFATTRKTFVNAPRSVVHELVNDFHQWTSWSPWEDKDPAMKRTYAGPAAGVGAEYGWEGNKQVGTGSMTITSSSPERIEMALEFLAPFKASNVAVFEVTAADGGTEVRWTMSGNRALPMAILGTLIFDRMIAKDFDKGLARLKAAAEKV